MQVEVRRANKDYVCDRCWRRINEGEIYARMKNPIATVGRPLCLECVKKLVPRQ
jgi:hypothetical protein